MTEKKPQNFIPAEELGDYRAWKLPLINDNGKVLSSAQKEAKEKTAQQLKRQGESVEDVHLARPVPKKGMTASEMQNIIEAAEKDGFTQGHADGFEKGKAEGYEAGQQQGLMEMRQQLVIEQQRFQKIMNALMHPLAEQDSDLEKLLLDVICNLTKSIVQRELITDSSEILSLVKKAVDALPVGSKNLRVSLNPDDLAAIEAYAKEQHLDWTFVSDPKLTPGGCKIETHESRVDFSVASRLKVLLDQFVNKQLAGSAGENDEDESLIADDDDDMFGMIQDADDNDVDQSDER